MLPPTVLDDVSPQSELVVQETFGPVAPIIRIADTDEAIAVANATVYGLQAGIVTRDYGAFMHLANRLKVGGVSLMDGPQFDSPYIPFGGVKKSGIGREGIPYAIREMTTLKTVVIPWHATSVCVRETARDEHRPSEPVADRGIDPDSSSPQGAFR